MMSSVDDRLVQIQNALLDLQGASLQGYERPLRSLWAALSAPELRDLNDDLTRGVTLEGFLASATRRGSMVGSSSLHWPDDVRQTLGITILLIEKFAKDPQHILDFGHEYYYSGNRTIGDMRAVVRQVLIPFVRDYRELAAKQSRKSETVKLKAVDDLKIFIVHGRNVEAKEMIARFVERIGLFAIILHEQPNQSRTIIEKVESYSNVGFAIVLLTPDDEGCIRGGRPEPRARENVILELGYFMGLLGRSRVCALRAGEVNIPSDFAGVLWTDIDAGGGWRLTLARELKASGYEIDWNKVMS